MAVPLHPAAIHPLTPGSPAYAILKIGAIGGLIGLRMFLARRSERDAPSEAEGGPAAAPDERPHPVSRRKAKRRKRRR